MSDLPNAKILESDGNIFTINADGTGKAYLTDDASSFTDQLASWSFDGSKIVFARAASGEPSHLWTMNADGSNKQQVTFGDLSGTTATFSPDGQSILFSSAAGGGQGSLLTGGELWLMNADGSNPHPLTDTTTGALSPDGTPLKWSIFGSYLPGGTKIAYSSTASGESEIWVMNSDGTQKQQLTFATGDAISPEANSPSWSPDGTKIAFAGGAVGPGGRSDIFTVNADGSGRKELTFGGVSDNPVWSPDGKQIFFQTADNRTMVMNADGSVQRPLFYGVWASSIHPIIAGGSGTTASLPSAQAAQMAAGGPTDAGASIITVASGNQDLAAPAAATNFDFSHVDFGADTITGFDPARDMIVVKSSAAADFAALAAGVSGTGISPTGAGTLIVLGKSLSIILEGVAPPSLTAADFRFV